MRNHIFYIVHGKLLKRYEEAKIYHIRNHVKKAGASLSSGSITLPDKVLLGVACHLGRSS